jgi:hypothetical protein
MSGPRGDDSSLPVLGGPTLTNRIDPVSQNEGIGIAVPADSLEYS